MTDRRLLTRIALRKYKSIGACDIRPAQLSFLVGPNEPGKRNFLEALRFVADALGCSIDHALRDRGGIDAFPAVYGALSTNGFYNVKSPAEWNGSCCGSGTLSKPGEQAGLHTLPVTFATVWHPPRSVRD